MLPLSGGGGGGELSSSALALTVSQLSERIPAQRNILHITGALCLILIECTFFICSPETNTEYWNGF